MKELAKTPTDVNARVPQVLGVNRAVIENVMFCHQEHSTWPFSDNSTLKKIFDDLFDTRRNAKLVEVHRKVSADLRLELQKRRYKADSARAEFHAKRERVGRLVSGKKELAQIKDSIYLLDVKLESFDRDWTAEVPDKETLLLEVGGLQAKLAQKKARVQDRTVELVRLKADLAGRAEATRAMLVRRVLREEAGASQAESDEQFLALFADSRPGESPNFKVETARTTARDVD